MSFTGVTFRNMGEGLLTGMEMTQRQLYHQSLVAAQVTAHKAGNLERTAQAAGGSAGWRVSFPGASVGLNLFRAGCLVSAFSQNPACSLGVSVALLV